MPDINAARTYTSNDPGFEFLRRNQSRPFNMSIAGTLTGTIEIQYIDDRDNARTIQNGTITALPWSSYFELAGTHRELQLVVTGTIDANVTEF